MKTTVYRVAEPETVPTMMIEQFADLHGLEMEVHERSLQVAGSGGRFYAHFTNTEVKDGSCLLSTHGNGSTVDGAIRAYARLIARCWLVVNAFGGDSRREINAPNLV